jgi:RNA polymerase sigma-70 factor, ECF subfamily
VPPEDNRVTRTRWEDVADEALMRQFQSGESAAFATLMRRHIRSVYNFVARQTGTSSAEDLTQEVFVRVVERAHAFKHEARFTTWLYAIARNLCIDHLRKMGRRQHPSLDQPDEHGVPRGETIPDPRPDASGERMASAGEMRQKIEAALASLPEEQREVFLLREVVCLPFQEIAKVTGAPENTVKSRMRYALERLQEALEDYAEAARALR